MNLPATLFLLLAVVKAFSLESAYRSKALLFRNVTVIDGTGANPKRNTDVLILDKRIASIGPRVHAPAGAEIVNGSGKFLIPGLWDMHVHVSHADTFFPLFLANGITGIRDTGMNFDRLRAWRNDIASGARLGPRMVIAGPILDGPYSVLRDSAVSVDSAEKGRSVVRQLKEQGADFIKVYNFLSREVYLSLADEAKRQRLPLVGHVPFALSAAEASDIGQKSIEHLSGVLLACSSREDQLRARMISAIRESKFDAGIVNRFVFSAPPPEIERSFSPDKARMLFQKFTRNRTWQVPTLRMLRLISFPAEEPRDDPRLDYVARFLRDDWSRYERPRTAEEIAARQRLFEKELEVVRMMRRAGVKMLAGTDTPNPYLIPGFSLHDELALLVRAGLTPMEALQSATRNPAEFLGILGSIGTVEEGKEADLVLLDADPLQDIRNTRRICAVVLRGRYLASEELQRLLAQAAQAARQ
jgi:hypothetical protein